MSPQGMLDPGSWWSFPRVSGDEPLMAAVIRRAGQFSPRERG